VGCNCGGGAAANVGTFEVTYPSGQKVTYSDFTSVRVALAANPGATYEKLAATVPAR
jgi:hypothetical protein